MPLAFLFLILAFLVAERIRHERRLERIPIRIHVNGTRGKSSVTRLIAAALRRSGIPTLAKTTGTAPVLILPDGSEETIRRRAPANILEQMKVVERAARLDARAVVVECMALDPELQSVSETAMIRSTVATSCASQRSAVVRSELTMRSRSARRARWSHGPFRASSRGSSIIPGSSAYSDELSNGVLMTNMPPATRSAGTSAYVVPVAERVYA